MTTRRGFMAGILAAGCSPALVKAGFLMPIKPEISGHRIVLMPFDGNAIMVNGRSVKMPYPGVSYITVLPSGITMEAYSDIPPNQRSQIVQWSQR